MYFVLLYLILKRYICKFNGLLLKEMAKVTIQLQVRKSSALDSGLTTAYWQIAHTIS